MFRLNENEYAFKAATKDLLLKLLHQYLGVALNQSPEHQKKITKYFVDVFIKHLENDYPQELKKRFPLKKTHKNLQVFLESMLDHPHANLFFTARTIKTIYEFKIDGYEKMMNGYKGLIYTLKQNESPIVEEIMENNYKTVMAEYKKYSSQIDAEINRFFDRRILPTMILAVAFILYEVIKFFMNKIDNTSDGELHNINNAKSMILKIAAAITFVAGTFLYYGHQIGALEGSRTATFPIIEKFLKEQNYPRSYESLLASFANSEINLIDTKAAEKAEIQESLKPKQHERFVPSKDGKEEITAPEAESVSSEEDSENHSKAEKTKTKPAITVMPYALFPKKKTGDLEKTKKTDWTLLDGDRVMLKAENLSLYEPTTSKEKFKRDKYYIYIDASEVPIEQKDAYTNLDNLEYLEGKDIWSIKPSLGNRLIGVEISHPDHAKAERVHLIFISHFDKHDDYTKKLSVPAFWTKLTKSSVEEAKKPIHSERLILAR